MHRLSKEKIQIVAAGKVARNANPAKANTAIDLGRMLEIASELGMAVASSHLIEFGPGGYGGDHAHERQEIMIAPFGGAILLHRDAAGEIVKTPMGHDQDGEYKAFHVPSWVPHAVVNPTGQPVTLFEMRDMDSPNFLSLEATAASLVSPPTSTSV